jgi:hypothetical protein
MFLVLTLCFLCADDRWSTDIQYVDHLELNYMANEQGTVHLVQMIAWEWDNVSNRFRVKGWRMYRPKEQIIRQTGYCEHSWYLIENEEVKIVRSRSFAVTVTLYDPEVRDREYWPRENRGSLFAPRFSPRTSYLRK